MKYIISLASLLLIGGFVVFYLGETSLQKEQVIYDLPDSLPENVKGTDSNIDMLERRPKDIETPNSNVDIYFPENYAELNSTTDDGSVIGSWSKCISLDEYYGCADYCRSVGKFCSNQGVTSRGYNNWAAEAWKTSSDCESGLVGAGQKHCADGDDNGGARWKCFCY